MGVERRPFGEEQKAPEGGKNWRINKLPEVHVAVRKTEEKEIIGGRRPQEILVSK